MSTRKKVWIYCLLALYTVAPILSVIISSGIASATGSRLDEAGIHPCVVLGVDIGWLVGVMFVAGWCAFLTVPTGLFAMLIFTVVLLIKRQKARTI